MKVKTKAKPQEKPWIQLVSDPAVSVTGLGIDNYWSLMGDEHFLATQVPQTPLEIDAFSRLGALLIERSEEVNRLQAEVEEYERDLRGVEEDLKSAQGVLDDTQKKLAAADNRIEELELELLNQGDQK